MANNKKSFILYCDSKELVNKMSDESAGKLFKHIFSYVTDENPETDDPFVELAFEHFKQFLKRDLKKYDNYIEKQRLNGKKGGRPRNPKEPKITQPFLDKPKKADSDNVNVNDINKEVKEQFEEFWKLYDKKTGKENCLRKFKSISKANRLKILEVVSDYVKSTPEVQYRKNPATWLNGKHWEDEIEIPKPKSYKPNYYQ